MTLALFDAPLPRMAELDPARCRVHSVNYETVKIVLRDAHYIGTPGATSVALGMYVDDVIAGVITFGTIPRNNASAICGHEWAPRVMELTRLALYHWAPKNSESWFIGASLHTLRSLRPDIRILVSYADESVGHVGTIYQATNWIYTGASTNDYVYVTNDGEVLHPRTTGRRRGDLPPGKWQPTPAKHRYIKFIGSRSDRRSLTRQLRWPALAYPRLRAAA
jgi:hypothetical protein